jgi:predicted acylesterase/phospholipase RssA
MEGQGKINNFVVGGGGTWGYAYIGAIEGLFKSEQYNMNDYKNIKNYIGCSIGAIISTMMACGASIEELQTLIGEVDPSKAQDDTWGWFRDLYRLYYHYGYYRGNYMEEAIKKIVNTLFENDFKKNGSKLGNKTDGYTFTDVYKQFGKNLIVNGVNVNTRETVYFNRLTHPNMEVSIAC